MDTISPSLDPTEATMARAVQLTSSPQAIISPSIPAPPSPPRRQTISSASEMPQKDLKAAVFSQHVASQHYVEHHRKAIESLRQQHREERAMWDIERQELLLKVAELEAKITRIAHFNGSDVPSIADKLSRYSLGSSTSSRSSSVPNNLASSSGNRERSLSPPGVSHGTASVDRGSVRHMESIPERSEHSKSVSFRIDGPGIDEFRKELQGQSIPGELVDKDLDGVMIKATSLPPAVQQAILSHSATPSPLQSPSPTRTPNTDNAAASQRPVTIEIPSTQSVLQLPSKALYTHAAGHTPMARIADSEEGTGSATPTVHIAELEKPPFEPHPTTQNFKPIRPPNERGDSYFNVPLPDVNSIKSDGQTEHSAVGASDTESVSDWATSDVDPALREPLSLPHRPIPEQQNGNGDFLSKLDERLTSLSKEQDVSRESSLSESNNKQRESNDPPLRIKRSLNFGSAWGSGSAGKNA